ncbi:MAG TPA: hypothetical protein VF710_04210 [Longimicrobium sp.]
MCRPLPIRPPPGGEPPPSDRSTTAHASSGTMISWWPVMWKPRPPRWRVGRSTTFTRVR